MKYKISIKYDTNFEVCLLTHHQFLIYNYVSENTINILALDIGLKVFKIKENSGSVEFSF